LIKLEQTHIHKRIIDDRFGEYMSEDVLSQKEFSEFYEGLVYMVSHTSLSPQEVMASLVKILVLLSFATGTDKQNLLKAIDLVWEYENFFQPNDNEVH
jgi:hypothetical protein